MDMRLLPQASFIKSSIWRNFLSIPIIFDARIALVDESKQPRESGPAKLYTAATNARGNHSSIPYSTGIILPTNCSSKMPLLWYSVPHEPRSNIHVLVHLSGFWTGSSSRKAECALSTIFDTLLTTVFRFDTRLEIETMTDVLWHQFL